MPKTALSLTILLSVFILSACTATARNMNYKLYKTRLQAQSYLTGKRYKVRPMISNPPRQVKKAYRVRKISNRSQRYCTTPNKRTKIIVVRKTAYKPRRVQRKIYQRPTVHHVKTVYKRPTIRRARAVYKRPAIRKVYPQRRAIYQRPPVRKTYPQRRAIYKRPAVRKTYPQRRVVYKRPVRQTRVQYRAKRVYQRPLTRKVFTTPIKKVVRANIAVPQLSVAQLNDGLFNAAKTGNIGQISALLDQGAQVNAGNGSKETALHAAAALGRNAAVSLLLQRGANPNATTTGGWTPLHSAARFKHTQIAALLVARGAQVNVRNNQGKTPLALATQVGGDATAAKLMALGGR